MNPTPQLQLQVAADGGFEVPTLDQIRPWVAAALQKIRHPGGELTIRVVDRPEMAGLSARYRGKRGATNVLSFPFEAVAGLKLDILGDVVICAPVVAAEAASQGKPLMNHWAHLVIHGTLHLCGFDHRQPAEAERMESLEQGILADLGIPHPWAVA